MDFEHFVVHIPHNSFYIPEEYKSSFCIGEKEIFRQQLFMTDAHTAELFCDEEIAKVRVINPVSRLLCDVERFRDDKDEYNAKIGQGLMYTKGMFGKKLREYDEELRNKILAEFYDPHHARLTQAVEVALEKEGRCTILDGHSFNSKWPVKLDCLFDRPDFCIGTDSFHTPKGLCEAMVKAVEEEGYHARINTPYSGTITPIKHYGKDKRVISVMVEVNRKLYMDERTGEKNAGFEKTKAMCRKLMKIAAEYKE